MLENNFTPDSAPLSARDYIVIFTAWIIPGLGHLLVKRWIRAAIIFFCVASLALAGYAMRGQAYPLVGGGMFGVMGHLAEIGAGVFYFLAHVLEPRGADTARVAGEFGTRFLATAGLLNFLAVVDVWAIAREAGNSTESL